MFDKKLQQNMVLVDTQLKTLIICFQHELKRVPITKQSRFILGIEDVEVFGELKMFLLKLLKRKCKSKLIWTKLTKIWQSDHNLVKGYFLNSVKGGYAIAIASKIAFLPNNLHKSRKVFHTQWRNFSILNMNLKIDNIVVKDIDDGKIYFSSPTKAHEKNINHLGVKWKHLWNTKRTHFFISIFLFKKTIKI
jgi:ribosomal protein S1